MIITRTPYRLSFFGGGTDYPLYYREHGGAVLNATINKYCYIHLRYLPPFFDHKYLVRYSRQETVSHIADIEHPSVRECLRFMGIDEGIELTHTGDIPAMSGVGSSSSFTVGLLKALYALKGKMVNKRVLAYDAIDVEQNHIGENVGSQDQVAASFGGINKIEFGRDGTIVVHPMPLEEHTQEQLQSSIMLIFTGISRYSHEIAEEQIRQTPNKCSELSEMRDMVEYAISILNRGADHLDEFGRLLHDSWQLKRSLTGKISNPVIDDLYDTARRAGALGGKVCGAGGGGFVLLYVPPQNRAKVTEALGGLLQVPFRFEQLGSQILHFSK
ncbi:kinase [uncultured Pseudodesulfovibrio sp.]|uniref:GHMP family kinase ATP-binding protein n=1 Tax=uncultured Pseudodesulfovibrio sp. TaxID=2035858 RepID=UPI0029C75952|nr:kinase [uncultured Pseudodesulfovibrio sp.]